MRIIIPPLASVFLLAPTNYVATFNKNVNTINQTQTFFSQMWYRIFWGCGSKRQQQSGHRSEEVSPAKA